MGLGTDRNVWKQALSRIPFYVALTFESLSNMQIQKLNLTKQSLNIPNQTETNVPN